MAPKPGKRVKKRRKDITISEVRRKLGLTQAELAAILGVSRTYLTHAEAGKRNLDPQTNLVLTKMYLQFQELEIGQQANYRTLETKLFVNDEYRKILPKMKLLEQDCRSNMKELKKEMLAMKELARDTENAIIVYTTRVNELLEKEKRDRKMESQIEGLNLFKQKAYYKLLTCWEPEQAKLQSKIESIAGEAKALRRYRLSVTREHNPFKL